MHGTAAHPARMSLPAVLFFIPSPFTCRRSPMFPFKANVLQYNQQIIDNLLLFSSISLRSAVEERRSPMRQGVSIYAR